MKKIITTFLLLIFLFIPLIQVHADYESIYHYYIEEGLEAFYQEKYDDALFYFRTAYAIDPARQQPMQYLNLIKREQEKRLSNSGNKSQPDNFSQRDEPVLKPVDRLISRTTELAMAEILQNYSNDISDSTIEKALGNAIVQIQSDTNESSTAEDWNKVKVDASTAVIKRIERLKIRNDKNLQDAVDFVEVSGNTSDYLNQVNQKTENVKPIDAIKFDIQPPSPAPVSNSKIKSKSSKAISSDTPQAPFNPTSPLVEQTEHSYSITDSTASVRRFYDKEELKLNDDLWLQHRDLTLEIEIGKNVIFTGKIISRYLATLQDLIEVTRIDKDRVQVKAIKRGNTIFYIWDEKGRWVFNIRCVYPFESITESQRATNQDLVSPFKFGYTNSWSTLHDGPKLGDMTQRNLIFANWVGVSGPTPYGDFDGSINTYRFPQSTEIIGQRIGLSNGNIGPFKDFQIRGYDIFKDLSSLTMTGRNFRGGSIDSFAFHRKILYSYFRGQDQSISIYSNDGNLKTHQSFVEGFKLTLNPEAITHQYTFNYAHGYGEARQPDYKNRAYSIEAKHLVREFDVSSELGYDQDEVAGIVQAFRKRDDLDIALNFRDIKPDYQTILGRPTNSGQLGASVNVNVKPQDFRWDTFLDLYQDRSQPSEDNPDLVNLDFSTYYSHPIDDLSSWGTSLSYVYTPQTVAPRQFVQTGMNYSKSIKVSELRYLSLSLGQTFQWSRYQDSPTSDFDRYGIRAGLRYKLFKNLFYSMSYDYLIVRDVYNNEWSNPMSLQAGVSYSAPLTNKLSLNTDISYRDEQNSQGNFSFLGGEDSLTKTVSFTYHPSGRVSLFMDSQLRRVWPHNDDLNSSYFDWNLMLGLRADWDLPFRWNPTGEVQGIVYKDYNGNSLQDTNEPGISGIKVLAGKYETKTNENGEYSLKVSAKKVAVSLDLKTIPRGFVFSTALSRDIIIQHNKSQWVNFGLTSRSGVYGVSFVDINGNGKPDRGDKFIGNIVVRLDTGDITKSDYSGSYFFENITPGRHKIKIDVQSIPLAYTPTVKIETEAILEEGMTFVYNIPLKENPSKSNPK